MYNFVCGIIKIITSTEKGKKGRDKTETTLFPIEQLNLLTIL